MRAWLKMKIQMDIEPELCNLHEHAKRAVTEIYIIHIIFTYFVQKRNGGQTDQYMFL